MMQNLHAAGSRAKAILKPVIDKENVLGLLAQSGSHALVKFRLRLLRAQLP